MARLYLICCVLIQVLLIEVVYGEIKVNCPNQHGMVGNPLYLICHVTCDDCKSTNKCYWRNKNRPEVTCTDLKREITSGNKHEFKYIIESASMQHNGSYTFWLQTNRGDEKATFNVTLEKHDARTNPVTSGPPADPKSGARENRHSNMPVAVGLIFISLILGILIVVLYRRKKKQRIYSPQCTCETNTV